MDIGDNLQGFRIALRAELVRRPTEGSILMNSAVRQRLALQA
jgi:hypothetical protein